MIYVEMIGRCGNQLFEYAIARKIQLLHNNIDGITFNIHYVSLKKGDDEYWKNALLDFNVIDIQEINIPTKTVYEKGTKIQKNIMRLYDKVSTKLPIKRELTWKWQFWLQPFMNKYGLYTVAHNVGKGKLKKTKQKDKFVSGLYENRLWFDDIRDILLDELTPQNSPLEKNKKLLEIILNNESVCLSVRRGDFAGSTLRDVCTEEYYRKAIDEMRKQVPNAKFVVFSDEIAWVKENYKFMENFIFEDGTDPVYEKLRLMYSCKHYIMSNSTFCWWAQYLSRSENKIVISPSKWMNAKGYESFIEKDWIKIEV